MKLSMKALVVGSLILVSSLNGVLFYQVSADDEFEVLWSILLPRDTYFIGEDVSFIVVAFSSTDPDVRLPDQMAKTTIRNQSLFVVFEYWAVTNLNGSATVVFKTPLDSEIGNYTIILEPLGGPKVIQYFSLLWNEDTYWQVKLDNLQEKYEELYDHMNYLYAYNDYIVRKYEQFSRQLNTLWIIDFLVLLIALFVFFPQLSQRLAYTKGMMGQLSEGLGAIGLTNRNQILQDFDEVVNMTVPPEKEAPRFNTENYCPICDKEKKNPMTLVHFEDHLLMHQRRRLRFDSLKAWWREKKRKMREERGKPPPEPMLRYGTLEQYEEDQARVQFEGKVRAVRKAHKQGKITEAQAKEIGRKLKQEGIDKGFLEKPEALKQPPSPKPEKTTKPPEETPKPANGRVRVLKLPVGPRGVN